MHHLLIIIHLLAATIWVGGHLLLTIRYLPQALKEKNPDIIRMFEAKYEIIGLPSLLLLVVSGILLSYKYGITIQQWFSFSNPVETCISIKLLLLFLTLLLAIHARLFIIPTLSKQSLKMMAAHIILITLVSIAFLVIGSRIRFGGW